MRPHRRQFLIGPRPVDVATGWRSVQLDVEGRSFLSHCPDLPVLVAQTESGVRVLLGDALATSSDRNPGDQLGAIESSEQLVLAARTWWGRWVLVADGAVHLDACGMLGCFWRADQGECWVSSSVALLAQDDIAGDPGTSAPRLRQGVGWDWYPGPCSRWEHVRRLLPSQTLSIDPVAGDRRLAATVLPSGGAAVVTGSADEQLDHIAQLLTDGMKAAARRYDELWLPLTGGYDSRFLLAIASSAAIPGVKTFTQTYPWPKMSRADRELPPKLAAIAGYEHRFLDPVRAPGARAEQYEAQTGGSVEDADGAFWAMGQWDAIPDDAAILRGAVFEVASTAYWAEAPVCVRVAQLLRAEPDGEGISATVRRAWALDHLHPGSSPHSAGIDAWAEWMERSPAPGLDWRDRYYLEQRVACWASAVAQGLDITGTHRVYLANCHELLSTALALPFELLTGSRWQVRLLERFSPELAAIPLKPADGIAQRVAYRMQMERDGLRSAPESIPYLRERTRMVGARLRRMLQGDAPT